MKLGLLTNSLVLAGMKDIGTIAAWASSHGFEDLEVGPTVPLEYDAFRKAMDDTGIAISSLIYCRNFLKEGQNGVDFKAELEKRLEMASRLSISRIVCSTGMSNKTTCGGNKLKYDPEAALPEVKEFFFPLIEKAEKLDVDIVFENCPMMGNIAISPYMWERLFTALDSERVGLALDPSHLLWLGINPYSSVSEFSRYIRHVHAKDCEIDSAMLSRMGILHNSTLSVTGGEGENKITKTWFKYRLPGLGDLKWPKFFEELRSIGYNGTVSIEHEDPVWEGSAVKVTAGILKARDYLRLYM